MLLVVVLLRKHLHLTLIMRGDEGVGVKVRIMILVVVAAKEDEMITGRRAGCLVDLLSPVVLLMWIVLILHVGIAHTLRIIDQLVIHKVVPIVDK